MIEALSVFIAGSHTVLELADKLEISGPTAQAIVKRFLERGLIERAPFDGVRRPYRLGSRALQLGQQLHAAAVWRAVQMPQEMQQARVDLGSCLRAWRQQRRLSQVALGQQLGVDGGDISSFERGERELSLATFLSIAEHLKADPLVMLAARLEEDD